MASISTFTIYGKCLGLDFYNAEYFIFLPFNLKLG